MSNIKLFIIARGRTGGTLMATMLNAHSMLTMAYEMYPDLLIGPSGEAFKVVDLIERLRVAKKTNNEDWAKALAPDQFRVFVARARRSGIEPQDLLDVFNGFLEKRLETLDDRLDLIDAIWEHQAKLYGKPFVGGKMRVEPEVLFKRHPDAVFIMMLRDGRDVLDSRLKVGNFSTTAEDCAEGWVKDLTEFEYWLAKSGAKGKLVKYENLVENSEEEMRKILELAGLSFENTTLNYLSASQPLFDNAHGHLSADQISRGLSSASIGRWRKGLNANEVKKFEAAAGEVLTKYGYI